MKLITWNTNGLRACLKKGFFDFLNQEKPDIMCIQETKMQIEQKDFNFPGYLEYYCDANKKGYSGTAILTKINPLSVHYGLNGEYVDEGRAITLEFADFYVVNVYSPNSQEGLARLDYRLIYEEKLRQYILQLQHHKPVILCGDLNVAHEEIDLKNPQSNRKSAGFSDAERAQFRQLLASGFIDTFRHFHPNKVQYTWWSYMFQARQKNAGWRIDYFIISKALLPAVQSITILDQVHGSDHCPVVLELQL